MFRRKMALNRFRCWLVLTGEFLEVLLGFMVARHYSRRQEYESTTQLFRVLLMMMILVKNEPIPEFVYEY